MNSKFSTTKHGRGLSLPQVNRQSAILGKKVYDRTVDQYKRNLDLSVQNAEQQFDKRYKEKRTSLRTVLDTESQNDTVSLYQQKKNSLIRILSGEHDEKDIDNIKPLLGYNPKTKMYCWSDIVGNWPAEAMQLIRNGNHNNDINAVLHKMLQRDIELCQLKTHHSQLSALSHNNINAFQVVQDMHQAKVQEKITQTQTNFFASRKQGQIKSKIDTQALRSKSKPSTNFSNVVIKNPMSQNAYNMWLQYKQQKGNQQSTRLSSAMR